MTNSHESQTFSLSTVLGFAVMMGLFIIVLMIGLSNRTIIETPQVAAVPTATPEPQASPVALQITRYDSRDVAQGRSLYAGTCAGCHAFDGRGITGLGHSLIDTDFINGLADDDLRAFIIVGRSGTDPQNTTGIPMPARGGNPSLSDEGIDQIIAFLRTEADSSLIMVVEVDEQEATQPPRPRLEVVNPTVVPYVELPPLEPREFDVARAYALSCSGCHGASGEGIIGLTQPLADSDLLLVALEEDLFAFIITGNPYVDFTSEIPHPARGDYPTLTDEQITLLIDHLHGLVGE